MLIDTSLFPYKHCSLIQCHHCLTKSFHCHYCHKSYNCKYQAKTHTLSKHPDQLNINPDVDDNVGKQSAPADDLSNQNSDDESDSNDLDVDNDNLMLFDAVGDDDVIINDHEDMHVNDTSDELEDNALYDNQFVNDLLLLEEFSVEHSIVNDSNADISSLHTFDYSSLDRESNLTLSSFEGFTNASSSA